ncbi:MAG: hemolysin family protein [Muribaculaceae bacterium]|nr:hemolysin family protein [Muribaculaceae bacterium]
MEPTWIIITAISLVLSGFFSGTEMAFVTADRVRTAVDVQRGGFISRLVKRFYANSEFFISTILVGNNVVLVIYGMGAAMMLEPWLGRYIHNEALILAAQTLISTAVILLTGEFLPKTMFGINPNSSLRFASIPIAIFYVVLYPVSMLATFLSRMLMKIVGAQTHSSYVSLISVGDLNDYLEEAIDNMEEKKTTVENEVKLFQNALDFSTTHVRDCMIPRNEIVAVPYDTPTAELSALFTSTGRSKIIVYRDDIDDIAGYIHVSELFTPHTDWQQHIKPVLYAPENLMANVMMRRLLQQKRSIAIVVDEFGGTSGFLTLEDLVEEIFGDIQDEHDKGGFTARTLEPGVYEAAGRCEIAWLNENLHLDIPEDDAYQTLAGYIMHSTGTIPQAGTPVELGGLTFEVIRKSATRLELIRITALRP